MSQIENFTVGDVNLSILNPTAQQHEDGTMEYNRVFSKALQSGALLREKLEVHMRQQNLWDDKKEKEYIEIVDRNGNNLLSLINDILDLSKIEAGKWQLTDVDLELLRSVEDVVRIYEKDAIERGLSMNITVSKEDSKIVLLADEGCIRRIVDNLISNAVKFTPDGGDITCIIKKLDDGDVAVVSGIGDFLVDHCPALVVLWRCASAA